MIAGFTSSALGAVHTYGSNDNDQRNILSAALATQGQGSAWPALLWWATGAPLIWSLASHTPVQAQQVNADWLAFRQSLQQKYANLIAAIGSGTTVSQVQAVTW